MKKVIVGFIIGILMVIIGILAFYNYKMHKTNNTEKKEFWEKIDSLRNLRYDLVDSIEILNDSIEYDDSLIAEYEKRDSILKENYKNLKEKNDEIIDKLRRFNANEHYEFFTNYLDTVSVEK
jgi:hypothetical protein